MNNLNKNMEIVYKKINELKPYENNPRINKDAIPKVAESISLFGFRNPIIIDAENTIICGHTRVLAAESIAMTEVPCIIINDLSEEKINAFRIIDNKTNEYAQWDEEKLREELERISPELFKNFDMPEFTNVEIEDDEFDIEKELEEIITPKTKPGEIIQLGKHLLLCGDTTNLQDINKLFAFAYNLFKIEKADCLITDPPYNVDIHNSIGLNIENDNMKREDFLNFLTSSFKNMKEKLKEGGSFYIWHADSEGLTFRLACENADLKVRQCLVWAKNHFVMGRQDYQWKHEPCLYGWKDGGTHYFIDDRTQTTLIKQDPIDIDKLKKEELKELLQKILSETKTSVIEEDRPLVSKEHPTMKPLKLVAKLISNSTKPEEVVFDGFGGSGSTLIAAEQLKRRCLMIEIDPKYCDLIVKRYEEITNEKAVRLCDNLKH